jgi:NADH-quinone oxidoreductase E subunit
MPVHLSEAARKKLDAVISRYPTPMAATLPALHIAQADLGPLTPEVQQAVADYLKVPVAHIYGVVTFYTMFHQRKVGKNVLMVCTNISCMLRGAYEIMAYLEKQLGVKRGETTADGMFTLVEEECLAACANAPMAICGPEYFLDLTPEKVDQMLADLRARPRSEHVDFERGGIASAAGVSDTVREGDH